MAFPFFGGIHPKENKFYAENRILTEENQDSEQDVIPLLTQIKCAVQDKYWVFLFLYLIIYHFGSGMAGCTAVVHLYFCPDGVSAGLSQCVGGNPSDR